MYAKMKADGAKSNLRLTLKIKQGQNVVFAYDVGTRFADDPFFVLKGRWNNDYSPPKPRFLEDYIAIYGRKNISIQEFGKYSKYQEMIEEML
jgi:hypothetical protein